MPMDPMLRKFEQAIDLYNQIEDLRLSIAILTEESKRCQCLKTKNRINWEILKNRGVLKIKQKVYWNFADTCITRTEILTALQIAM